MANTYIELKKLVYNTGQIEGVPRNPREWTKEDVSRLAASIVETPELFEARPLLVVPRGERFVVIGGNMRLAAARELAMDAPPCYEIQDRSVDNLKRMAIKDNSSFGKWEEEQRRELPKYAYPDNVVTSAFVARLSRYGIDFSVSRAESVGIDALDAQKEQGRAIYGKGYLVSERAAAERAAAIRFALSPREREIVAQLGKAGNNE